MAKPGVCGMRRILGAALAAAAVIGAWCGVASAQTDSLPLKLLSLTVAVPD